MSNINIFQPIYKERNFLFFINVEHNDSEESVRQNKDSNNGFNNSQLQRVCLFSARRLLRKSSKMTMRHQKITQQLL